MSSRALTNQFLVHACHGSMKCPCQESNLVYDLRRVACFRHTPETAFLTRRHRGGGLHFERCFTMRKRWESNPQGARALGRLPIGSRHHSGGSSVEAGNCFDNESNGSPPSVWEAANRSRFHTVPWFGGATSIYQRKARDSNPYLLNQESRVSSATRPTVSGCLPYSRLIATDIRGFKTNRLCHHTDRGGCRTYNFTRLSTWPLFLFAYSAYQVNCRPR